MSGRKEHFYKKSGQILPFCTGAEVFYLKIPAGSGCFSEVNFALVNFQFILFLFNH